jgi:hypothetical protein
MPWDNTSPSRRTRRNRRIRGGGTWGVQGLRLDQAQHNKYQREMGGGLWSDKNRRLDRARRQRERAQRRGAKQRSYGLTLAASMLILSLVLLATGSGGAGVLILALAATLLYVRTARRKT